MNRRLAAVLLAVLTVFTFVPMASAQTTPTLSNIRTGQHNGFDRVVLDLRTVAEAEDEEIVSALGQL